MGNPFVPGFGLAPHVLVGREQLLSDISAGLTAGPTDQRFVSLLTGVRGSGKTVALEAVQDAMERQGWIVLQVDATTKGLPARIVEAVNQAKQQYETDVLGEHRGRLRVSGVSVAGFGINWAEVQVPPLPASGSAMTHLSTLAAKAQQAGTSVLLTIDELQGVAQDELRRLAADIQHITSRKRLPLALVAAGLPQVNTTLMSDKTITFLQRCHKLAMPMLSRADALQGLNLTVKDAGGAIEPDALNAAANEVQGSPYRLQLLGYNAWKISGAPNVPIGLAAVTEAIPVTNEAVTENVSLPAWYDLNDTSQSFLESLVASKSDAPTVADVADPMGISTRHARRVARALELSGYININADGKIVASNLVPVDVIRAEAALIPKHQSDINIGYNQQTTHMALCGERMPRANTNCILTRGHKGGHRSKT